MTIAEIRALRKDNTATALAAAKRHGHAIVRICSTCHTTWCAQCDQPVACPECGRWT